MKTSRLVLTIVVLISMASSIALAKLNVHKQGPPLPPGYSPNSNSAITLGWSQQTSGITTTIYSAKAVSQTVAWMGAAGPNVVRTTDGTTWTSATGTGLTGDIYAVTALDANFALATSTVGTTTRIFRTLDGGATWTTVYTQTGAGAFIDALHMFDANNGIALGDPVGGKWTVVRTTDAGVTWVRDLTNAPTQAGTEAGSNNGFAALDANTMWFTSNSSPPRVYRTTNGGTTWASSIVPGTSTFNEGIAFFNASLGLVGGNSGGVYRTTDGGANWTSVFAGTGAVYGISTAGVRDAWMNQAGAIWHSGDKGATWDSVYRNGTGQTINHMHFVTYGDSASGWTAGASGTIAAFYGALTPPPPNNDIRPSAIVDPFVHSKQNAAFSPKAKFFNAGSASQSGIPVRFQILNPSGSIVYNTTSTLTGPLGVEQESEVTFSSFTIPVTTGAYTARAISENADAVPSNDTLSVVFYVPNNLSGVYTVGTGGNLATFKAAVDTLSRNDVAGPITFSLTNANYSEPPLLIENVSYATASQIVTIKPASGVSPRVLVTGASADAYGLSIVNSSNIVIEGSNTLSPNSLDWTIEVDSTSTVSRVALNMVDVKNITVQNLKVKGYYNPLVGTAYCINMETIFGSYNANVVFDNVQMSRGFGGLLHAGAAGSFRDSNITIRNCTIGNVLGSLVFRSGIDMQNVDNASIHGNVINGINYGPPTYAGQGDAFGVSLQGALHSKVYNNKISNIANVGTGSNAYRVAAISVLGDAPGTTSSNSIFNNMIWDVRTLSTSTGASVQGIYVSNGAGDSVYYNSVYLSGSTVTNTYSAAFQLDASACNVKNNVFFNNRSDGTTGRSIAIFKGSTAGTSILTSNNNVLFAAQLTGKVGAVDTVNYTALLGAGSWNVATGQDGSSRQGNPRFISATNLHVSTTTRTPVESGGTPIAGTDIDGDVRNASTPDIGADEGTFLTQIAQDMQTISIDNPVAGLAKKAGVAFSAKATFTNNGSADLVSVPVRFRINSAPAVDLTATIASLASGAITQVTFTPAITIATPGDYVATAIAELGTDGDRTTDTITIAMRVRNPLAGTYPVPGSEFTTVSGAVSDLKAVGVSSAVTFLLANQTFTQTSPVVIDTIVGASASNTVTFKPAPGASPTITGDISNDALITFNGCDYVIFDGSNTVGGTTRDLTVSNTTAITTGTGAPVFWIHAVALVPTGSDMAKKNVIKNCNIKGGVDQSIAVNTVYGILMSGTPLVIPPTVGTPNDSNTYSNNYFSKVRIGIWLQGGSGIVSTKGTVISDNVIGPASFGSDQIGRAGIILNARQDGTIITRNEIRYVGGSFAGTPDPGTSTAVFDRAGIGIGSDTWPPTASAGVTNSIVTRNLIHHIIEERGNSAVGIIVATSSTTNATIANNMIHNVRSNGSIANKQTLGIGIQAGGGDKVVFNSISLSGDLDPVGAATATQSAAGIRVSATTPSNLSIKSNVISVDVNSNTGTLKHYAIVAPSAAYNWGTGGSNYNDLYAPGANPQMVIGGIGTVVPYTDKTTLVFWRHSFSVVQDSQSVSADPSFVGATDLHITSGGSPASNSGTTIAGVTDDVDGDVRNVTTPDMGADEFTASTSSLNVAIALGWNLISNPMTNPIPGDSVRQLYPSSLNAYAFEFSGGYIQKFRLANGKGYWEKFPAAISNGITGTSRTRDSVSVAAGWNIVGSISNTVDTNTIVSVPPGLRASNWFGYSAGYIAVTQLVPGKGYWVKSSAVGKFVLANPLSAKPTQVQASGVEVADVLNSLTITDSRGGSQTLYFGADANNAIPVAMFTMPPAPPEGAFDARFESADGGSMVQTHPQEISAVIDLPIAIQSSEYPLTVSWKLKDGSYELSDGMGGAAFATRAVKGEGSLKVTNSEVHRLMLKVTGNSGLPKEFALSQNYPNPFNPTTNVKYALPVDSRVTVQIYNVIGQRVHTLVNDMQPAGYYAAEWNGTGNAGQQLASGVYFLHLSAQGVNGKSFNEIRKLMMLK